MSSGGATLKCVELQQNAILGPVRSSSVPPIVSPSRQQRDGGPRALRCSPYIAPLGAPPRSSLVSPLRSPVWRAPREFALRFSLEPAPTPRAFGLVTDSEKVRVGRRGWWRGRCDRTQPCRLLSARSAKSPANSHDLYPRCCLRSPTPEQRRRRPLVGRMSQLPAAYRPQPHSSTACARALAGRPTCTRFSLRGTDGQIRAAQQACWRLASL